MTNVDTAVFRFLLAGNSLLDIDVLNSDHAWAHAQLLNEDEVYQLKSATRGRAIIINNEYFVRKKDEKNLSDREGSLFDAVNLCQLFSRLGFQTETWDDVSAKVNISALTCAGSHGNEILEKDGTRFIPEKKDGLIIKEKMKNLDKQLNAEFGHHGAWVENKGTLSTFHYR